MTDEDETAPDFASPPCMAGDFAADDADALAVTPARAREVARWRRTERERLRAERRAMGVAARRAAGEALGEHLRHLLASRYGGAAGRVLSAYWPIRGEPDMRPLMAELHAAGVTIALPVVEVRAAPLAFRRWTPETRMVRGVWDIPVPPQEAGALRPDIMLSPLLGWDGNGYRLGNGGGYFDRTLAALSPRPATIGVGFQGARLVSIHPLPHDVPLDLILTDAGVQVVREAA